MEITPGPRYIKFIGGVGTTPSQHDRIHVTIRQSGQITLNRKAHSMLGSPQAVVLWYDPVASKIAVAPAHHQLREAFPVRNAGGSQIIHARSFCLNCGIRVNKTQKFVTPEYDENGFLHLDLKATVQVGGRKKLSGCR